MSKADEIINICKQDAPKQSCKECMATKKECIQNLMDILINEIRRGLI